MKKALALIISLAMMLSIVGCGSSNSAASGDAGATTPQAPAAAAPTAPAAPEVTQPADTKIGGNLTIYTTTDDSNIERVIPAFEELTGVDVEIISGSAGECISRIQAEQNNPQCDVQWGGLTPSDLNKYPDLWEPYVSANDADYPAEYRSNGYFNYFMLQTINLLVNTELADELGVEIKGYNDLLNPALKGKIIHADPTSSSSAWRHLSTQLLVMGGYDSQESWDYLEKFIQNLDGVTTTSSSAVYKQVAEGEYVVGLTYENVCVELLESGADNVQMVYMDEGTTCCPFGAAVVKDAKNMEQAKAFIDYLTSDDCQRGYAEDSSSRPANTKFQSTNDYLVDLNTITVVPEDQDYLSANKSDIQTKWTELWAKYN
ncbi:MAG: extracellular solute-binding protein [Oscillospiraceae bacterium]|nr:extracellular solute-binding protein [Oscillospiraceae bacterium]